MRVFVAGATGSQGGAVCASLLANGHTVVALTRDPSSKKAVELTEAGATVVPGDMEDRIRMTELMRGADAAFAVTAPSRLDLDDTEARQGISLADAAHDAGVAHLVFASAPEAPSENFKLKRRVELHIATLGIPATIVAPTMFMQNLLGRGPGPYHLQALREGEFRMAVRPSTKIQYIACEDIGAFVAHVVENGERFAGQRIAIASDEASGPEVAEMLGLALGKAVKFVQQPMEDVDSADRRASLRQWDTVGFGVDIPSLHHSFPQIPWHRLRDWIPGQDWGALSLSPSQSSL